MIPVDFEQLSLAAVHFTVLHFEAFPFAVYGSAGIGDNTVFCVGYQVIA
jgi:hypothetical protein